MTDFAKREEMRCKIAERVKDRASRLLAVETMLARAIHGVEDETSEEAVALREHMRREALDLICQVTGMLVVNNCID